MPDDGGVLGNLPNSRPGKRSAKRDSAGRPAKAPRTAKPPADARPSPPPERTAADPVASVVRTAATVAATGVRVAGAVTQEILRRLPRP